MFLSTLGGNSTVTKSNRILKHLLTNELAKGFNFAGHKNKESFQKFYLKATIVRKLTTLRI